MENNNTSTPIVGSFSIDQFPILAEFIGSEKHSKAPERAIERFKSALGVINESYVNQQINNPVFKETKEFFSRRVNDGYKSYFYERFNWGADRESLSEAEIDLRDSVSIYGLHECKSAIKRVRASKVTGPMIEAMKAFLNEVEPLVIAFDELKPLIKKRVVLSEEEKEQRDRFVPPLASEGAVHAVYTVLQAMTQGHRNELLGSLYAGYERNVVEYVNASPEARKKLDLNPHLREGTQDAVKLVSRNPNVFELMPNYKELIMARAEKAADKIQLSFVSKNLKKLAAIVDRKPGFQKVEEVGHSVNMNGLSGTLRVSFDDGANFIANNSVVFSYSIYGKPFLRYPLTFHDVVMSDGSKMKFPCEERMISTFAPGPERSPLESARAAMSELAEDDEAFIDPEQAQWTRVDDYPLEKLGSLEELTGQFVQACAKAEDDGLGNIYEDLMFKPIETPIVVLEKAGKPFVWDGAILAGAAARNGAKSVRAIVGVPLAELTQEKQKTLSASVQLSPEP